MAQVSLVEQAKLLYDAEGDVLYISFGGPQLADDSELTDEGIVLRLREGRIVGLTILNAAKRILAPQAV